MSSSYNTGVQITLAQSHIVSKNQDKLKKAPAKQQDDATRHVSRKGVEDTERVAALNQNEHDQIVHNDDERKKDLNTSQRGKKTLAEKKALDEFDIVRDESKGKKISVKC